MSAVPELIIPMRLDIDEALKQLNKLKGKAGEEIEGVDKKAKGASESVGLLGKTVGEAGSYMKSFVGFQAGLQAIHMVAGAIADEMARVSKNIDKSTKDFSDFRKSMIEYAGITKTPLNNAMVGKTIGDAKMAGIDPKQYIELQKMMLEKTGGQIGINTTKEQIDEITRELAPYMQAKDINPADIAGYAGMIMRDMPKGTSTKQIKDMFGRGFGVAEDATGDTKQLLPEIVQAGSAGFSVKDSTIISRVMAENGTPRMTSTYNDALARAMRQIHTKDGKDAQGNKVDYAKQLGVTTEMGFLDSAEQVYKKAQEDNVNFDNEKEFGIWLDDHGIKEDTAQKAMRVLVDKGIKGGLLKSARDKYGKIGDGTKGLDTIDAAVKQFQGEEVGQEVIAANRAEADKIMGGEEFSGMNKYKSIAEGKYFGPGGGARTSNWGDTFNAMLPNSMYGTAEEMSLRKLQKDAMFEEAQSLGLDVAPNASSGAEQGISKRGDSTALKESQAGTVSDDRALMVELLKRIEEKLATANEQRGGAANKPLQTKAPAKDTRLN